MQGKKWLLARNKRVFVQIFLLIWEPQKKRRKKRFVGALAPNFLVILEEYVLADFSGMSIQCLDLASEFCSPDACPKKKTHMKELARYG